MTNPVKLPFLIFGQVQETELLGRWSKNSLVGSALYNNAYNEVWGISRNGQEYAVIGSTIGTHFIDITDLNLFIPFYLAANSLIWSVPFFIFFCPESVCPSVDALI